MKIQREITPLKENDCFLVFDRKKKDFDFPIHFHPEYEINFVKNAKGAKRIIGDHIGEIDHYELVMTGPNIYHKWENGKIDKTKEIHEITIQFPLNLFNERFLNKNILKNIRKMFTDSKQGILFSQETAKKLEPKLNLISKKNGFENFLEFLSLINELALSKNKKILTNLSFENQNSVQRSERIEIIYKYIKKNYRNKIKVEEASKLVNMTIISFSRLMKRHTGKTFIEFVNELRLGYATRRLIESNDNISEICFDCGFNNISNFNRIFRKYQNCTPTEFRENFIGTKNIF